MKNTERYFKQLVEFGNVAMKKIPNQSILIVGMNGLGSEIAKNLVLSGVKKVTLWDQEIVTTNDLSCQFFLTEKDLGCKRNEKLLGKLKTLNSDVAVDASDSELTNKFLKGYEILINCDNCDFEELIPLNERCRECGVKFVHCDTRGLFGSLFCDFGSSYRIEDLDGKKVLTTRISEITRSNPGVVTNSMDEGHKFQDGDWIEFREVLGMTELNGTQRQIKVIDNYTFSIGDTSNFSEYRIGGSGGYCTQVKLPFVESHLSLKESLKNPEFNISEMSTKENSKQLLLIYKTWSKILNLNSKKLNSTLKFSELEKQFVKEIYHLNNELKDKYLESQKNNEQSSDSIFVDNINENLVKIFSKICNTQISPLTSIIGGIASQEILKACTGKYTPIKQWLFLDFSKDTLPENFLTMPINDFQSDLIINKKMGMGMGMGMEIEKEKEKEIEIEKEKETQKEKGIEKKQISRYHSYIQIFGKENQEKIHSLKYFLVGLGGYSCELLKNWSLMGLGQSKNNGMIHLSDYQKITNYNLYLQFLFNNNDLNQYKDITAANKIKQNNPNINIKTYSKKVEKQSENIFNSKFYENLDGMCNCSEKNDLKLYLDKNSTFYKIPFINSQIIGTKGKLQVVIPYLTTSLSLYKPAESTAVSTKTESDLSSRTKSKESIESRFYSNTENKKTIPHCTLHNFPHEIDHTILFSTMVYKENFDEQISQTYQYIENEDYFETLEDKPYGIIIQTLESIKNNLGEGRPFDFTDCIKWGRKLFQELFYNKISQLMYTYPENSKINNESDFWLGKKRFPSLIDFNLENELHYQFLISAAKLRAKNYQISYSQDKQQLFDQCKKTISNLVIPKFVPKDDMKFQTEEDNNNENEDNELDLEEEDEQIEKMINKLPKRSEYSGFKLFPQNLELVNNDDENAQIDFIYSCSNLRAINYRIKNENKTDIKQIAGEINPGLITTASILAGLSCLETYKIIQNINRNEKQDEKTLKKMNNCCFDLSLPVFHFSTPLAPIKTKYSKDSEKTFTNWDTIDILEQPQISINQFIKYFKEKFNYQVLMLTVGNTLLYNSFSAKEEELEIPIKDLAIQIGDLIQPQQTYLPIIAMCTDSNDNDVDLPLIRLKLIN
ncbi:hypothetical protein M0812_07537 [Anaeramoeba flamelloides]|uniref:Ubiquitin-activating enzyme E1 C-terminal domain-containing protein n=1 Tax=Anaeramoeba flamelloides TaxID=1746091 RepID=A0AAV8A4Z0_9EUKA|nr:hypothetical protein M0812_07537 [Anaeramoeba flamelloides]